MVQRAGRIDRIGTDFDTLGFSTCSPTKASNGCWAWSRASPRKIAAIDASGFPGRQHLGRSVHPQNFNTLRRIGDEDGAVIEEEEQFTELASSEFLLKQLRELLDGGGREALDALPDGIHSGLRAAWSERRVLLLSGSPQNADPLHFWKYYDLKRDGIIDNRYLIANLIACDRDTPRVVDPDIFARVFESRGERAIEKVLQSSQQQINIYVVLRTRGGDSTDGGNSAPGIREPSRSQPASRDRSDQVPEWADVAHADRRSATRSKGISAERRHQRVTRGRRRHSQPLWQPAFRAPGQSRDTRHHAQRPPPDLLRPGFRWITIGPSSFTRMASLVERLSAFLSVPSQGRLSPLVRLRFALLRRPPRFLCPLRPHRRTRLQTLSQRHLLCFHPSRPCSQPLLQ